MKKFLFIAILSALFAISSLNAAIYKGQRVFIAKCLQCHESGESLVTTYTIKQWKKLMDKSGKGLAEIHLKSTKAKKSWRYFKSKKYNKKAKYLEQFLVEYAKDSGNVPVICN